MAVEAIPELACALTDQFAGFVANGRLTVIQAAVHSRNGEIEFDVNPDWSEWSSAHGASKARTARTVKIKVATVRLCDLIERLGVPRYLKIDIEGGELDAVTSLQDLRPDQLPTFLSFEINPLVFEVLQKLWDLGYRQYQLVRQGAPYLPAPTYPCKEGLEYRIPFTRAMSGPFGNDLPENRWVGLVEIVRQVIEAQREMRERSASGENPGWYDIHAKRSY